MPQEFHIILDHFWDNALEVAFCRTLSSLFHSIVICIRSADQYTLLDRPLNATLYIALLKFILSTT